MSKTLPQGAEVVSLRLGRHVAAHCEDLLSGMRTVQDVGGTLAAASVVAGNGRRRLAAACARLETGHLALVQLQVSWVDVYTISGEGGGWSA